MSERSKPSGPRVCVSDLETSATANSSAPRAGECESPASQLDTLLDEQVRLATHLQLAAHQTVVGEVIDARHPHLLGRVKVSIRLEAGNEHELWVPSMHGLSIRVADRVLVTQPGNFNEPVVTGVIDGFASRPELPKSPAARLELERDETITVVGSDGAPLLEVSESEGGSVVRLCRRDTDVQFAGKLVLSAEELDLRARRGQVNIKASEDVVVVGETIRLN